MLRRVRFWSSLGLIWASEVKRRTVLLRRLLGRRLSFCWPALKLIAS